MMRANSDVSSAIQQRLQARRMYLWRAISRFQTVSLAGGPYIEARLI